MEGSRKIESSRCLSVLSQYPLQAYEQEINKNVEKENKYWYIMLGRFIIS